MREAAEIELLPCFFLPQLTLPQFSLEHIQHDSVLVLSVVSEELSAERISHKSQCKTAGKHVA